LCRSPGRALSNIAPNDKIDELVLANLNGWDCRSEGCTTKVFLRACRWT